MASARRSLHRGGPPRAHLGLRAEPWIVIPQILLSKFGTDLASPNPQFDVGLSAWIELFCIVEGFGGPAD
eukprot:7306176-Pyramimonas_sp.AAC.1